MGWIGSTRTQAAGDSPRVANPSASTPAALQQGEERRPAQAGLPKHEMEEMGRDVAAHLVAEPDLEDLASGEGLLPGFVLPAPHELEAGALKDHPELSVGGRGHLVLEERAYSFSRGIGSQGADVRSVRRAIEALTEPLELGLVLLRVVKGHLDEVGEGGVRSAPLGAEVQLGTERHEDVVTRLDDGSEPLLLGLDDYRHGVSSLAPEESITRAGPAGARHKRRVIAEDHNSEWEAA